ncbi:conserved hypothetical protein [Hyella patelloides LEGE 07179]|uniref:DUF1822 domain-containing protein n=1 Tax=Hyella patelloides LEGE 07179 TaxID=945734 RepID=A0A563W2J2_9CYAN|nr:DUF1822 family protein [Hyella patelloides]VEP17855.1 conserved hypothetical protein [Hyella patelloides LEGE 07179]
MSTLLNPNQLILEISAVTEQKAQNKSQKAATSYSEWQTYLNQLVLDTFVDYAQEEQSENVKKAQNMESIGELVNGTVLNVGNARIILIPSEADDLEELRVPQEWIDIPQLAGDYYLAVQINIDDRYLRVWGYTTHQQLKTDGNYSVSDRCYTLDGIDIIGDISALWVARELCPDEVTKAEITPLTEITSQQADNLIKRLGNKENLLPRLAVPFTIWAALLSNDAWRNDLIAQRCDKATFSVLKWLQAEASNIISEIGWRQVEFQPSTVGARGNNATATSKTALAKQLTIAGQSYELKLIPVEEDTYGFELRSLVLGGMIPAGFTLRLLTETREGFEGNEDTATTATESLYLEVALDAGEGLIWEIEPTPEDYQAQVLYF